MTNYIDGNNYFEGSNKNEKYMWLNNKDLQISPEIQRMLDHARAAKIAANYNPMVANPVKVSYRNGKYYIIDSMHTREAQVILNGSDDFPIFCRVFFNLTIEEEARLFALQFGFSEAVSMGYRLRALAVAKDPDVLRFLELTEQCGFAISLGTHKPQKGRITAYCTAFKAFMRLGDEQYVRMLRLIHMIWAGELWSVSRNMIRGMSRFMKMYDFSDSAFIKAFRHVSREDIIAGAASFSSYSAEGAFAQAIAEMFDARSTSMLGPLL